MLKARFALPAREKSSLEAMKEENIQGDSAVGRRIKINED
jgi:hypothetical protein